jgi:hypothetical protein
MRPDENDLIKGRAATPSAFPAAFYFNAASANELFAKVGDGMKG